MAIPGGFVIFLKILAPLFFQRFEEISMAIPGVLYLYGVIVSFFIYKINNNNNNNNKIPI